MINKQKLINAIFDSHGVLTKAAQIADCSLKTIYNHRDRDTEVANAIIEAKELADCRLLDLAEDRLEQAVNRGDFRAIKYVLSTKGKSRGYTERAEIEEESPFQLVLTLPHYGRDPIPPNAKIVELAPLKVDQS